MVYKTGQKESDSAKSQMDLFGCWSVVMGLTAVATAMLTLSAAISAPDCGLSNVAAGTTSSLAGLEGESHQMVLPEDHSASFLADDFSNLTSCNATWKTGVTSWTVDLNGTFSIHHVLFIAALADADLLELEITGECCSRNSPSMTVCSKPCIARPTTSQPSVLTDFPSVWKMTCEEDDVTTTGSSVRLFSRSGEAVTLCGVEVIGCPSMLANVAEGKPAEQSSNRTNRGIAPWAVDGDTRQNYLSGSCTHTAASESLTTTWWNVDLQQPQIIFNIRIYNRIDCCDDRLSNFTVEIGKMGGDGSVTYTTCYFHDGAAAFVTNISCAQPMCGRYVRIIKAPSTALTLCEVQVFARDPTTTAAAATTSSVPQTAAQVSTSTFPDHSSEIAVTTTPSAPVSTDELSATDQSTDGLVVEPTTHPVDSVDQSTDVRVPTNPTTNPADDVDQSTNAFVPNQATNPVNSVDMSTDIIVPTNPSTNQVDSFDQSTNTLAPNPTTTNAVNDVDYTTNSPVPTNPTTNSGDYFHQSSNAVVPNPTTNPVDSVDRSTNALAPNPTTPTTKPTRPTDHTCNQCRCVLQAPQTNISLAAGISAVQEEIARVKEELTVQTNATGKYTRKNTSAVDLRESSKVGGLVAIAILAVLGALIVLPDAVSLCCRFLSKFHQQPGRVADARDM